MVLPRAGWLLCIYNRQLDISVAQIELVEIVAGPAYP
jgi:hypothetical protein